MWSGHENSGGCGACSACACWEESGRVVVCASKVNSVRNPDLRPWYMCGGSSGKGLNVFGVCGLRLVCKGSRAWTEHCRRCSNCGLCRSARSGLWIACTLRNTTLLDLVVGRECTGNVEPGNPTSVWEGSGGCCAGMRNVGCSCSGCCCPDGGGGAGGMPA